MRRLYKALDWTSLASNSSNLIQVLHREWKDSANLAQKVKHLVQVSTIKTNSGSSARLLTINGVKVPSSMLYCRILLLSHRTTTCSVMKKTCVASSFDRRIPNLCIQVSIEIWLALANMSWMSRKWQRDRPNGYNNLKYLRRYNRWRNKKLVCSRALVIIIRQRTLSIPCIRTISRQSSHLM